MAAGALSTTGDSQETFQHRTEGSARFHFAGGEDDGFEDRWITEIVFCGTQLQNHYLTTVVLRRFSRPQVFRIAEGLVVLQN